MIWIIDRFEGDYAVVGCGDVYFDVPIGALPECVREGDVLEININVSETESRTEQLKNRLNNLFGE